MDRGLLIRFYGYLVKNGVIVVDEVSKSFRWVDNFSCDSEPKLCKECGNNPPMEGCDVCQSCILSDIDTQID